MFELGTRQLVPGIPTMVDVRPSGEARQGVMSGAPAEPGWNQQCNHWGDQPGERAWGAGESGEQSVASASACRYVWRVSATGENVTFRLRYGTLATLELVDLCGPVLFDVPGKFELFARPRVGNQPARARATLTQVRSSRWLPRVYVSTPGNLVSSARRATALVTPTTLNVRGVVIALNAGQQLDLAEPSALNNGAAIVECAI